MDSPNLSHLFAWDGRSIESDDPDLDWTVLAVADFIPDNPLIRNGHLTMFTRKALSRGAQLAARQQGCSKLAQRRGYAAAATSSPTPASFAYDTSDVAGIKVATRDSHGPTTKLAVVAKAGTRYEPAPGLTAGLEEFAFKVHSCPGLRVRPAMS